MDFIASGWKEGFNSLQTGKCIQSSSRRRLCPRKTCFNSLQTGKCIQRKRGTSSNGHPTRTFQFPSNGKVYPKFIGNQFYLVTIKFQFPSNGKVYPKFSRYGDDENENNEFQFPSNGKVYPKWGTTPSGGCQAKGFNSLQTGKCIQS